MKHLVILIKFVLCSLLAILTVESRHIVKRVVGGFPASPGQFPFQVSIRNKYDDHICGGSIIDKKFILTAGHCLIKRHHRDIYIVAGTNRLSEVSNTYKVEKIAHGHFNSKDLSNDISLIKLSEDISFTDLIQPILFDNSEPPINAPMTVSGWGYKHFGDFKLPDELQYVEVMAISLDECLDRVSSIEIVGKLNDKTICTFTKFGEGVCSGDSGGPLVYDGKLVGIVSNGKPCAAGYPDVFTKISEYYNWIQNTMSAM